MDSPKKGPVIWKTYSWYKIIMHYNGIHPYLANMLSGCLFFQFHKTYPRGITWFYNYLTPGVAWQTFFIPIGLWLVIFLSSVSDLNHHWFKNMLVTYLVPSFYADSSITAIHITIFNGYSVITYKSISDFLVAKLPKIIQVKELWVNLGVNFHIPQCPQLIWNKQMDNADSFNWNEKSSLSVFFTLWKQNCQQIHAIFPLFTTKVVIPM